MKYKKKKYQGRKISLKGGQGFDWEVTIWAPRTNS